MSLKKWPHRACIPTSGSFVSNFRRESSPGIVSNSSNEYFGPFPIKILRFSCKTFQNVFGRNGGSKQIFPGTVFQRHSNFREIRQPVAENSLGVDALCVHEDLEAILVRFGGRIPLKSRSLLGAQKSTSSRRHNLWQKNSNDLSYA